MQRRARLGLSLLAGEVLNSGYVADAGKESRRQVGLDVNSFLLADLVRGLGNWDELLLTQQVLPVNNV